MSTTSNNSIREAPTRAAPRWLSWTSAFRRGSGARHGGAGPTPEGEAIGHYIKELIAQGRYAFALLKSAGDHVDESEAGPAWRVLARDMALVPFGRVVEVRGDGTERLAEVRAFYLDRHAVTNQQFEPFVKAGCYDSLELWPSEVWPSLMQFTDRTGQPGPAGWSGGTYPAGRAQHPVVGVCWYEAAAYARWVGKRLATAIEWQKAGGWPDHLQGGSCTRYPWGDLFDPARANLQPSGRGDTVAVTEFPGGDTPNGIHQMTGNVWEWLDDRLDAIPCHRDEQFQPWKPLRRIIGGAYDTYLLGEATCHFSTGQPELDRRSNIGFRCALSIDRLRAEPADS